MLKKLSIIGAFLGLASTANAFDLEIKLDSDIYSFAKMSYNMIGEKGKESFHNSHSLSMPFQHNGGTLRITSALGDNLYLGVTAGGIYDWALSTEKKTTSYIVVKDKDGTDVTANHPEYGDIGKVKDHKSDPHSPKYGRGGFWNVPIALTAKYNLPIRFLMDYDLMSYVIANLGVNLLNGSNEDADETEKYDRNYINPIMSLGMGLEYNSFQIELSLDYSEINYHQKAASSDRVRQVTYGRFSENNRTIHKSYSKLGFHTSVGYRIPNIF